MMPDIVHELHSIFKLKSILGIFIAIFCILCLRKLITLGVRWKKVLLNWGYRTVNVPSLWIPDVHGPIDTGSTSSSKLTTNPSYLSNGEVHSFVGDPQASPVKFSRQSQRVPALRLPDAWPNFLLTWLHLNLDTLSALSSAWVSAINNELSGTDSVKSCQPKAKPGEPNNLPSPFKSRFRLELTGIHQNHSVPPRLSCIETSASGSTKELHFRCTLFTPEVCLELLLNRTPGMIDPAVPLNSSTPVSLLLHMKQVTCRLKLVCLAVDKSGTVALSWDLISPLMVDHLDVLTAEDKPLVMELSQGELRWLKDTVYLAIQKAVPNVMVTSSLDVYDRSRAPHLMISKLGCNLTSPRPLTPPYPEDSNWLTDALSTGPPGRLAGQRGLHLRVITAVLLDPSADGHLVQRLSLGELLHCAIRSNTSWLKTDKRLVEGDIEDGSSSETIRTPGARLELKPWPTSSHNSSTDKLHLLPKRVTVNGLAYMAIWNYDAILPLESSEFNLLDVCLFTEATANSENQSKSFCSGSPTLFGSAVLPLSTAVNTSNSGGALEPPGTASSSPTQHVVLVDCQVGRRPDWSLDTVEHEEKLYRRTVKFMILLRAQLIADSMCNKTDTNVALQPQGHIPNINGINSDAAVELELNSPPSVTVPLDGTLNINTAAGVLTESSYSSGSATLLMSGRCATTSAASHMSSTAVRSKQLTKRFFSLRLPKRKRADISSSLLDSPTSAQSSPTTNDAVANGSNQTAEIVRSSDSFPKSSKPRFLRLFGNMRFRKSGKY